MSGLLRVLFLSLLFVGAASGAQAEAEPRLNVQKAFFNILPRKDLKKSQLGLNSFANDQRFGSISSQFRECKNVLGIKHIRVLFNWNDAIQGTPQSPIFWGFYDEIAASIPSGVGAIVIVNGLPSWMQNPANWIGGDARKTFIERWAKPVMSRYAKNKRIKGWQIWNEPNMYANPDNITLGLAESAENYVEMLALGFNAGRSLTPKKKIISAATTALNQNFPESLDYNKAMLAAGAENFLDIWGVHIYGMHLENFIRPGGVTSHLTGLKKPIWITESGEKGTGEQLNYARRMWPFLLQLIPGIERIYIYQFAEPTPAGESYGLKTLTRGKLVSDLYLYLKNKKK